MVELVCDLYSIKQSQILVIKIFPFSMRTKIYQIILNHNDLKHLQIDNLPLEKQIIYIKKYLTLFPTKINAKVYLKLDQQNS